MKFFNRYTLLYAFIVLIATLLFYCCSIKTTGHDGGYFSSIFIIVYVAIIIGSVLLIQRKDEYSAYAGFNYHFITYLMVSAVPVGLVYLGFLSRSNLDFVKSMMLTWGIGILIHFLMYLFMFRKKAIKSYDKEEIFK